jgi:hypothetical protein
MEFDTVYRHAHFDADPPISQAYSGLELKTHINGYTYVITNFLFAIRSGDGLAAVIELGRLWDG